MTSRNASSVRSHGQGARGAECRVAVGEGVLLTTPAVRESRAASRRVVASAVLPMTLVKVETELR